MEPFEIFLSSGRPLALPAIGWRVLPRTNLITIAKSLYYRPLGRLFSIHFYGKDDEGWQFGIASIEDGERLAVRRSFPE